jgi:tetratricopeptide (TPR) repeat protein
MTDPGARPGVWLSINGEASPSIPQGAAIIIRATALSARNKPLEFKPDGVQLAITDVGGKAVTWPLKRAAAAAAPAAGQAVSQPTAAAAKAMNGGTVTWVLMDSGSIPPGDYRLAATLPTAMSYPAQLKVVPPLASPTDAQKAQRFLTDARAALALGDPQRALGAAEQRLKTSPRDIPALRIKADALAAMGRTKDAALAYTQALGQFTAQNPKAPEPPLELIRSYQSLEAGK